MDGLAVLARPSSKFRIIGEFKVKRFITIFAVALYSVSAFAAAESKVRKFRDGVKDEYIVRLSDSLPAEQVRSLAKGLSLQHGGRLGQVFPAVVPGFVVTIPDAAAEALSRHPLVEYVEQVVVSTVSQVQTNAPWHLDRIDQRTLPLNGRYYGYCTSTPVYAYIVDTGIKADHKEFWLNSSNSTSRVVAGKNVYDTKGDAHALNPCSGATWMDDYQNPCSSSDRYCTGGGHGTAVASLLGGLNYGVAKYVSFISVRTHSCSGKSTTSTVSKGLEWIYNDKPTRLLSSGAPAPAVLNMSFTSDVTTIAPGTTAAQNLTYKEEWINKLITERNITVVVAAGNYDRPASEFSPARMARGNGGRVITAGGSTNTDRRWKCNSANAWETCSTGNAASNWGGAVDIFAPSQNISSAGIKEPGYDVWGNWTCCVNSTTSERQVHRSGTSFAAPIVAGIAARHMIGVGAPYTPDKIWDLIRTEASGDYPSTPPTVMPTDTDANSAPLNGSPNRLLYRQGSTICRM